MDVLHHFIWVHASVSDATVFDFDDCILSYPIYDEVFCSFVRALECFEGSDFPLSLHFFDHLYCCCCIVCGGIVGIYVDGWIVHPCVVADDGTVLLHGDDDGEVSICASFLEVVGLYAH